MGVRGTCAKRCVDAEDVRLRTHHRRMRYNIFRWITQYCTHLAHRLRSMIKFKYALQSFSTEADSVAHAHVYRVCDHQRHASLRDAELAPYIHISQESRIEKNIAT